ncbi:hypothetical protein EDD11_002149 [Mortierella claussenii]|nr:hypothetical protein EDD11_002149 [Mortierella claussenii]
MPVSFWKKGLGMGRKLSLTNLAIAVHQETILSDHLATSATVETTATPASSNSNANNNTRDITSSSPSPCHLLSTPVVQQSESENLQSGHSSVLATVDPTPPQIMSKFRNESPDIDLDAGTDYQPSDTLRLSSSGTAATTEISGKRSLSSKNDRQQSGTNVRASTMTTDTATTLMASRAESPAEPDVLHGHLEDDDNWRRVSMYSEAASDATTTAPAPSTTTTYPGNSNLRKLPPSAYQRSSSSYQRSRATDILLNLESSSNDARFQEILHNTIALDHFRQFCFQEYSIENLLFWMDVELFSKPSAELFQTRQSTSKRTVEPQQDDLDENESCRDGGDEEATRADMEQFAVQHARYIYLTYIDSCGPLQVNLSEESRTEIPWPILDYRPIPASSSSSLPQAAGTAVASPTSSAISSSRCEPEKKKMSLWNLTGSGGNNSKNSKKRGQESGEVVGWPLDRHMFDGAQEHTYQLMKGHTLVRFEESELWRAVQKIKREQPEEYAKAIIRGPLSSQYRPNKSVILSTVNRSRSRLPSAKPTALYNWNNSTSDLDRSRDKEEALAKTMSQYFGPIPASIRHPGRVILGLGRPEDDSDDDDDDDDDNFDEFDPLDDASMAGGHQHDELFQSAGKDGSGDSKRLSTGSLGILKKSRFPKRWSDRGMSMSGRAVNNSGHSNSSGGKNGTLSTSSDELLDLHLNRPNDTIEIDSVENGRRTTRWMVAGYFNDQFRLTAAQRKRLLRRNNKLTKFFGSRVDGTLRPVEQLLEGNSSARSSTSTSSGRHVHVGSTSAPSLGSPLAYALSSSAIHDMDKKSKTKKNSSGRGGNKPAGGKRSAGGGGSHDTGDVALLLSPGGKATTRSKSANILQFLKKGGGELEDDVRGYRTFTPVYHHGQPGLDSAQSSGSGRTSLFASRKGKLGNRNASEGSHGHARSMTATGVLNHRSILAHPHPLWSGSLSDQEGIASTGYERRRGLSILSLMGNNTVASGGSGATPTTPTSAMTGLFPSARGAGSTATDGSGGARALDRQSMSTRRKKADKLSTFFGAQLTTVELSSQLPMEHESHVNAFKSGGAVLLQDDRRRQHRHGVQRVAGPTFSSVNQLSHHQRTVLWKRSKKLKGLLGESLPESEVALALTRPVLMGSFGSRLRTGRRGSASVSGRGTMRRKRQGSLHSCRQGSYSHEDEDEDEDESLVESEDEGGYGDEDLLQPGRSGDLTTAAGAVRSSKAKGRIAKRSGVSVSVSAGGAMRARRPSTVSVSSRKSHTRVSTRAHAAASNASQARPQSHHSLDSLQTLDAQTSSAVADEGDLTQHSSSRRRRQSSVTTGRVNHASASLLGLSELPAGDAGASTTTVVTGRQSLDATMSRYDRKKKMDKIQQFLGDRVPEQDLWIGTIGREKTQEMLGLNLLSPTSSSSSGSGSRSSPNSFSRHGFSVKSKSRSGNTSASSSMDHSRKSGISTTGSGAGTSESTGSAKKAMASSLGGVRLERSLSDPPTLFFGRLELDASLSTDESSGCGPPAMLPQRFSTASRLRQQLASPVSTHASSQSMSGIGQLLANADQRPHQQHHGNFSSSSSCTWSDPSSPTDTVTTAGTSMTLGGKEGLPPMMSSLMLLQERGHDHQLQLQLQQQQQQQQQRQDDSGDDSAQILPRLRAMSDRDQERFLKRAEKLEKLFGHFPPSVLLLDNHVSSSSSSTEALVGNRQGQGENSVAIAAAAATSVKVPVRQGSRAKLTGFKPNAEGNGSSTKEEKEKEMKRTERECSTEDTIESLAVSNV